MDNPNIELATTNSIVAHSGLTPAELVKRHIQHQDDVITDADMENLDLSTKSDNEEHLAAAIYGQLEESDAKKDSEAEEGIDDEEEELPATLPDDNEHKPHITPWDILS